VYKDSNHKPEIAIALCDDFIGCYGFTSIDNIVKNLGENPILAEVFPPGENGPDEKYLKDTCHKMFFELDTPEHKDKLTYIITGL
jgi:mannose-6-phosphate isomerase class I